MILPDINLLVYAYNTDAPGHRRAKAVAIEHQAELHSNDGDFSRFPGLRWTNPLQ